MRVILFKIVLIFTITLGAHSVHALTVFDPANYRQNLVQALRALEEIENQIKQIQNQAQMIARMDKNLLQIKNSIANDLKQNMDSIQELLNEGENLVLSIKDVQNTYKKLFPKEYDYVLNSDDYLRKTQQRLETKIKAFERALKMQGQIADNIKADRKKLNDLLNKSRSSEGLLQAQQYGNEIAALAVQQSMQLQLLIATQNYAENIKTSQEIIREEEAWKRFDDFFSVKKNR